MPQEQLQSSLLAAGADAVIQAAAFLTVSEDASVVPRFADALLVAGKRYSDGTVYFDLEEPLVDQHDFVGRDTDFARLLPKDPRRLTARVRNRLANGTLGDLFLVLHLPRKTPFPGFHHAPPEIGLDSGSPAFGLSYSSLDGKAWTPASGNFMFKLILGPDHGEP